uniref:SGNH hydrolase-type esterase domain-containing protein n=1 Tax=Echeneis naucrates TaxID=173247 RepID=A0A665V9A3_ECHNA
MKGTFLICDSILRNVRLRGALTLSFPGTNVIDITEKIPSLLDSHPQVNRVVIHVGTNDTSRQQSELSQSPLCVFISGPSRVLSLNTWLSSDCSTQNQIKSNQIRFICIAPNHNKVASRHFTYRAGSGEAAICLDRLG